MKRIIVPSFLLLGLAYAAGAQHASTQPAHPEMVVTAEWLAQHVGKPNVVVLHVGKSREEYERGHIPGARFLEWREIAQDREGVLNEIPPQSELVETLRRLGIDDRKRIVLYDAEQGISAARGYVIMDYLGLGDRAALLDGQFAKWKQDGRPVSTETPKIKPSDWTPTRVRPEIIVQLDEMKNIAAEKRESPQAGPPVIDARSPEEYSGAKGGEGVPRAGHIPGAANLPSGKNSVSKEQPEFRPVEILRRAYGATGAKSGEPVVVYCRTGGQASMAYFMSKYLGYEPRLYDGSFSQWSSQEDTKVERATAMQGAGRQ